jgi:hypothetical protein
MLNSWVRIFTLSIVLSACAHHGAMRVECEGPLRPINRPVQLSDAPVSVLPASPDTSKNGGNSSP